MAVHSIETGSAFCEARCVGQPSAATLRPPGAACPPYGIGGAAGNRPSPVC